MSEGRVWLGTPGLRRMARVAAVATAVVVTGAGIRTAGPQMTPLAPGSRDYVFTTGAGILFFYVKPDKGKEFEAVVGRLSEALDKTADPVLKQQAASWRILKSVELQTDSPVYVFIFDPAVTGANYDPVQVLASGAPPDLQTLYSQLKDSTIRVERMALAKLR